MARLVKLRHWRHKRDRKRYLKSLKRLHAEFGANVKPGFARGGVVTKGKIELQGRLGDSDPHH